MAMYKDLNHYAPDQAAYISGRLFKLRRKLHDEITDLRRPNSLMLGSWNIRNFDNGFGGLRTDDAFHFIAEIIDQFDICAVQEVMNDLAPLRRLVRLLGPQWDYFVDVTAGARGNNERSAFVYNKNKVFFRNLVGEIVLKEEDRIDGRQFARTPFFAAFQAHWFRFILCSTHIIYGGSDAVAEAARAREIKALAVNLKKRAEKDGEVYILLGDMNVVDPSSPTMAALRAGDLMIPDFGGTNLGQDKYYDQITFTGQGENVRLIRHGKFDWRDCVFTANDKAYYAPHNIKEDGTPRYQSWDQKYGYWASHQMSDHLPIWVELEIDYSDDYLRRFMPQA